MRQMLTEFLLALAVAGAVYVILTLIAFLAVNR